MGEGVPFTPRAAALKGLTDQAAADAISVFAKSVPL